MERRVLSEGRYARVSLVQDGSDNYVEKQFRFAGGQPGVFESPWGNGSIRVLPDDDQRRPLEYFLKEEAILKVLGGKAGGNVRIPHFLGADSDWLTIRIEYVPGYTFQEKMWKADPTEQMRLRKELLKVADSYRALVNQPQIQAELLSLENDRLARLEEFAEEGDLSNSNPDPYEQRIIAVENPYAREIKLRDDLEQIGLQGRSKKELEDLQSDQIDSLAELLLELEREATVGIDNANSVLNAQNDLVRLGKLQIVHGDLTGSNCIYIPEGKHYVLDFSNVTLAGQNTDYVRAMYGTYPSLHGLDGEIKLVRLLKSHNPEGNLRDILRTLTLGRVIASVNLLGHNCEADQNTLQLIMNRQAVKSKQELISIQIGNLLEVLGFYCTGEGARELPKDDIGDKMVEAFAELVKYLHGTQVADMRPRSQFSDLFEESE